ncbi:unnamed protein product, partial [Ilex paraguariensis]
RRKHDTRIILLNSCERANFHSSLYTSTTSSFLFHFKPKRFHFLKPCSSLKETKKQQTLSKSPDNAPQSFRRLLKLNPKADQEGGESGDGGLEGDTAVKGTLLAGLLLVSVVGGFGAVGYIYKEQINAFLTQFSGVLEGYGPAGYALFVAVYAGLEVLAIPAIPLTMSAGLLFLALSLEPSLSLSAERWLGMLPGTWAYVSAGAFGRAII